VNSGDLLTLDISLSVFGLIFVYSLLPPALLGLSYF